MSFIDEFESTVGAGRDPGPNRGPQFGAGDFLRAVGAALLSNGGGRDPFDNQPSGSILPPLRTPQRSGQGMSAAARRARDAANAVFLDDLEMAKYRRELEKATTPKFTIETYQDRDGRARAGIFDRAADTFLGTADGNKQPRARRSDARNVEGANRALDDAIRNVTQRAGTGRLARQPATQRPAGSIAGFLDAAQALDGRGPFGLYLEDARPQDAGSGGAAQALRGAGFLPAPGTTNAGPPQRLYAALDSVVDAGSVPQQPPVPQEPVAPERPAYADFESNFPSRLRKGNVLAVGMMELGRIIGGKVDFNINGIKRLEDGRWNNTCAIRVSKALNDSGIKIPYVEGETASGANGDWFFYRARTLRNFLEDRFGPPDVTSHEEKDFIGKKGVIIFPGSGHHSGHADPWNGQGCDGSCPLGNPRKPAELWVLPD